jgi:hypothetical protein
LKSVNRLKNVNRMENANRGGRLPRIRDRQIHDRESAYRESAIVSPRPRIPHRNRGCITAYPLRQ